MWTDENRARYNRDRLRYPSDLTDEEWALIEPLIPPGKPGGGKRRANMREVVNGLMYVLSTGCQWRAIPKDLPPRSTVYDYFSLWTWDRGGSACLDSAPLVLSGFLPGLSNAGPGDFVAAEGGRSPTAAATKSWRGYAAATNACTPK